MSGKARPKTKSENHDLSTGVEGLFVSLGFRALIQAPSTVVGYREICHRHGVPIEFDILFQNGEHMLFVELYNHTIMLDRIPQRIRPLR